MGKNKYVAEIIFKHFLEFTVNLVWFSDCSRPTILLKRDFHADFTSKLRQIFKMLFNRKIPVTASELGSNTPETDHSVDP